MIKPNWPVPDHVKSCVTTIGIDLKDLKLPAAPCVLKQEHGIKIINANTDQLFPVADGSFAINPLQICVVATADCLPILIADCRGTFVAALHAGWRGLAQGIIGKFFNDLSGYFNKEDLLFWLGPAISSSSFVIKQDVYQILASVASKAAFSRLSEEHFTADLYQIAKDQLSYFGINKARIYGGNYCTFSQKELFYSYRRKPSEQNRIYSLIWLDPCA